MLKEVMFREIDEIRNEMTAMSDDIFDHPEIEWKSSMPRRS